MTKFLLLHTSRNSAAAAGATTKTATATAATAFTGCY